MEIRDTINIAKDFSDHPAARYRRDGDCSGEAFLEDILEPKFQQAQAKNYLLMIDLNGVYGYPSSFVSGSFGKLALKYSSGEVLKYIRFESSQNPLRIDQITREIQDPKGEGEV